MVGGGLQLDLLGDIDLESVLKRDLTCSSFKNFSR